ncbi:MAG TPA: inner membrane CreD family protein [Thiolinea sp.]|nr:inner membrane CreD family protein [Thiolinea sp.]
MISQGHPSQCLAKPFYSQPIKALLIGLILLLCLLPLQQLKKSLLTQIQQEQLALEQAKQAWGGRQQLIGPLLVIPYTDHFTSVDTITEGSGESKVLSKDIYSDYTAIILPSTLEARADLSDDPTTASALKTSNYKANVSLSGHFDYAYLLTEGDEKRTIHWEQAVLGLGITDTRALSKPIAMTWNGEKIFLKPGSQVTQLLKTGVHANLEKLNAKKSAHDFKIDLMLHGSEQFLLAPVGETTTAHLSSSWEQGDFQNSLAPLKEEHNKLGLSASWELGNLTRPYPQTWLLEDKTHYDLSSTKIGIDLSETKTLTSQLAQLLGYASWILLISLAILFSFELIQQQAVHLLQYLLFAAPTLLFFVLLLSLSREFPLKTAYLMAAIACLLIILIHSSLIFKSIFQGLLITGLLSGLYYLLYLALKGNSPLALAASVYAGILALLGLIVAWSLVPDEARSLRPGNLPEQEENTHI